ncbi:RNA-binding region RNP-1 (RNA recognition motif):FAD linked oxidase, C-terminal:FAD linked oxidase, N-terminal [Fulvimarina pelagi HTCC2506]|uniref:RNA-binding region RNP-1 (RNA recognition motif):FAD linked oxidase, C-terminal:FAD linked oxidase, N-terminal n=1 Tax=Fulvimarina pelagi HTCC2506 TaxID=314231 RepID=Q0G7T2_9HYPH|nr:FAD-binding oxidoreductase [Fulvimarina pelagi]EAU42282.1 RNA-binding region RNP-1 (RNA recognition motif):FAD linked oxidase, C-terminal:FAD linked oxidase, N-terminal [Fulvimarina pelagi HTCC2506]
MDEIDSDVLTRFSAIVGRANALKPDEAGEGYFSEPRDLFHGKAALVLRPGSVDEVAQIVKLAAETGTPVVPQGGNTGLVGGQQPRSRREILVNLSRLNTIHEIDTVGRTMTVGAGVILQTIQEKADAADLFFPLSLGAKGSCQIGGNLSSNAGGTGALAYGVARDLCLGIEAVLPNGEIVHGMRRLKKDNRGYDLRHLLIGAEGTLGIITGAVLKLFPKPKGREVAYAGLKTPEDMLKLLGLAERHAGANLTAFEFLPRIGVEMSLRHTEGAREPLAEPQPWYVLVEIVSQRSPDEASETLEALLSEAFEAGLVTDAAIAQSQAQADAFWTLREEMSWAQKPEGGSIKHDVSVPVAAIPTFLRTADAAVLSAIPDARIVAFGHLGDGNVHYNISQPVGADKEAFLARWDEISRLVHAVVRDLDGSFSAEHGIGAMKAQELAATKAGAEYGAMVAIKQALDPKNIMNPGKVIQN